ncbi:flagellar FlbD family protein [Enterococcus termitis]|uniref:Uncharacterized protein n=1 Tax=Enterococcus termitis TaxID=332950 RepID=A0A1E5GIQ0_9ENTE|nr:flagellar FlbD family protein [Enterococcus termitis]OEG12491.1 hypothetical protein BCR25_08110 [Enterococcus termitis]
MIELTTAGGYKRSILAGRIVEIAELPADKRSATVLTLTSGESVFVREPYIKVIEKYKLIKQEPASSANDTSH